MGAWGITVDIYMDRLPSFALEEIFEYMDPHTAFFSFPLACRTLRAVSSYPPLLSRYLSQLLSLQHDYSPSLSTFSRLLPRLYNPRVLPTPVPLTGFATTGGIDENNMHYWVHNAFTPNSSSAYCSRDHKNNIVVCAVLTSLIAKPQPPELTAAKGKIARLLRTNEQLQGMIEDLQPADSTEDLTEFELGLFFELYRLYPFMLFPRDAGDSQANDERERYREFMRGLSALAEAVSMDRPGFKDVSKREGDDYYLEKDIDKGRVDGAKEVFVVKETMVSRKGGYTCPLETFVLFVSEAFVPLESELFAPFDNLLTPNDVLNLPAHGGPASYPPTETPDLLCIEFHRTPKSPLHPVLWGKFRTRQGDELETPLRHVVAGKYVYLKLINPENRMVEMRDVHEFTNIDLKFVGVKGVVETLT